MKRKLMVAVIIIAVSITIMISVVEIDRRRTESNTDVVEQMQDECNFVTEEREQHTNNSTREPSSTFVIGEQLNNENVNINVELLGNPFKDDYMDNPAARNVWDMISFNGKLFLGSGDYDKNTGGVELRYYDMNNCNFGTMGKLPDEEIRCFRGNVIDNQVLIPGIDSTNGWEYGNWYSLTDNGITCNANLSSAAHCFDICEYQGDLFFALGTVDEANPYHLYRSSDGSSFEPVHFMKDDKEQDVYRVYDLYTCNSDLYAVCEYNVLYKYDSIKNVFKEVSHTTSVYLRCVSAHTGMNDGGVPYTNILVFKNEALLINKRIILTSDFSKFDVLPMAEGTSVFDALVENGKLYLLSGTKMEDKWRIAVYSTPDLKNWDEELSFSYPSFARSFELVNGTFYLGIGSDYDQPNAHTGEILRVTF